MLLGSYTNTDKGQDAPASEHSGTNGNVAMDQISAFLAGRVTDYAGGFGNAFIFEADWVPFGKADSLARPWVNLKLGAQYIVYTQFNGGTKNYDGSGRNASDNNTLYLFA